MQLAKNLAVEAIMLILILSFLALMPAMAKAQNDAEFPKASIRGTHVRKITSSIVKQEYEIHISLPKGYADSDEIYPVMYLLDSDISFGMMYQIYWPLEFGGAVQKFIIVGIGGYGDKDQDLFYGRSRDYTPTEVSREKLGGAAKIIPVSGGASDFLDFVQKELCPFIESEYRVNPAERCLAGASLGGLFCMYALFHAPDFFNRYIVISPSLWWDNRLIFDYEKAYSKKYTSLVAHIYLSMGAMEPEFMLNNWHEMIDILRSRDYNGLEITSHLFDEEIHVSVGPAAFTRGMRAVFPPE